jgi:hypothetical protein
MKAYGGVNIWIHIFFTSALVGGEWSASCPGRIIPGTHRIGGWLDPRAGLDDVEERKFLTIPGLELRTHGRPARNQSTPTEQSWLLLGKKWTYKLQSSLLCTFLYLSVIAFSRLFIQTP